MRVTLSNGNMGEITMDEAERIAREIRKDAENNKAYWKKAVMHLKEADRDHATVESEEDIKKLLVRNLPMGFGKREVEVLYEAFEALVADFYHKITGGM